MESNLRISERLRKLLPPLTDEERAQLKENIIADGQVREAIVWWNDGEQLVVVDGMNRWEIVQGTEIPYRAEEMKFPDYDAAELWILNHQLGRRNLLRPADIRKIRGELYNRLKASHGGDRTSAGANRQNVDLLGDASEQVAAKAGVSARTVQRDGARVEAFEKLTKAATAVAQNATDADVKSLAKLDPGAQDQVARLVRTGQAKSIKAAIQQAGVAPSTKSARPVVAKTGRAHDIWEAQQVMKTWSDAVGRWMNGNPAGIDVYREKFPGPLGDKVIEAAKALLNALEAWKRGLK